MKYLSEFLKTTFLAALIAPIAVSFAAFITSFFIPVGTYQPEVLVELRQKLHLTEKSRPMISEVSLGSVPKGRDAVSIAGLNLAGTVRQ